MKYIQHLSISTRVMVATVSILMVVVAANYLVFVRTYSQNVQHAMVERAAAFTAVADSTKNHVSALHQRGSFDHERLTAELQEVLRANRPYQESEYFRTIPIVSGWMAAAEAASRESIAFRISSFDARNKEHEPEPGSFDEKLLRQLTEQAAAGADDVYAVDEATNTLHYMRAIRLTRECMGCHGKPGSADDHLKTGKDFLGFAMEGWREGEMHGAYHVAMPLDAVDASVKAFVMHGLSWTAPMGAGGVLLVFWFLRRVVSQPLAALLTRMRDIAEGEGDLTRRVDAERGDEVGQLGRAFNTFIQKMHDVIREVATSSCEVASAATQIAAASEEMAAGMHEQMQQVTQITSAMEEMSASVVEVANKSALAADSATESGKVAEEGGSVVAHTVEGMHAINEAVSASATSVEALGKRGEQIGQIIDVINDIAEQTNLLALNAAIEAARAGEHGRGFAVVADEVRKLADRTTKATEEIARSIETIQTETTQAVERMNTGTQQVQAGVEHAQQAGSSLEEIVAKARSVTEMIRSIAAAAQEQAAASEQVSRNVESISAVTRQASEGAGQAAAAAAQLSVKAEQLQRLVGQFKLSTQTAA